MKAIIISLTKYKEKDAIIDAISESGYITFKAHGILDPKNKNASLTNPLSLVDLTFTQSSNEDHMILKESTFIYNPMVAKADLEYLSYLNYLVEVSKILLSDEDKNYIYPDLHQAIIAIKNEVEKPLLVLLKYTLAIFKYSGFDINVSSCVRCGEKKGIVAFSFQEGGFICSKCIDEEVKSDFSIDQMLLIRNLYLNKNYIFKDFIASETDQKFMINKFIEFIYDAYGHKIRSLNTINLN